MARPLRIEYPNAYYHVTNSGEDGLTVFPGERYYSVFLQGVAETCRRLNVEVHGFCLLKNAYHLLIKTPEGNLSRFMRQVDGLYTQQHQRLKHSHGSVFRARYKAVLLQPEKYLLNLSRFLHCLPGKGRQSSDTYPWSSYGIYTNKVKPEAWFNRSEILAQLGPGGRLYLRYARFVAEGVDAELKHFYSKKNLLSILGDAKFRDKAQSRLASIAPRGVSRSASARRRPSLRQVIKTVADHFKVSEQSICQAARGPGSKNLPRWIAMHLCQELSGVTLQIIADRFGLKRYGTVSTTIGKLKQEMKDDPKLQRTVSRLSARLKT